VVILSVAKMITTKKGDQGQSHFLGKIVDKNSPLLEAVGTIDELQAVLELIGADEKIIDDLMAVMSVLACDSEAELVGMVDFLEREIEKNDQKFDKFLKFKTKRALEFNWARTVARRAERRVVALNKEKKVDENILKYFNRLSDYLFIKAQNLN